MMYNIAVISHNGTYLDSAVRFLSKFNSEFSVRAISDPSKINEMLGKEPIDIYVCDHDPPNLDALTVFDRRLSANDFRPFIIASKISDKDLVLEAFEKGVSLWVPMDDSYAVSFMKISKKIVVLVEKYRTEQNTRMNDRRLASLVKLSRMGGEDFSVYMTFALEESINLTNSTIGYLALYNSETQELDMKMWSKNSMDQCMVESKPMKYYLPKAGLWGEPVRRKRPMVINDYSSDSVPKKGLPHGHVHLKRLIMIPLMYRDEVIGTAGVGNKLEDYDERDLNQFILMMEGFTHIYVERKQYEETNSIQRRLRNVLMNSPNGILALDGDMRIIDCSDYMKELLDIGTDVSKGIMPNTNWITDGIMNIIQNLKYTGREYTDTVISSNDPDGRKYRVKVFTEDSEEGEFYLVTIEDYTSIANMSDMIENSLLMRKTHNDIFISALRANLYEIKNKIRYITDGSVRETLYEKTANIDRDARLIKEYGDVGILDPEWIKLADIIGSAKMRLGDCVMNVNADGILLLCDYTFYRVFEHLAENGRSRGGMTRISVTYKVSRGNLMIIYEDDAAGIPYNMKSECFDNDIRHENSDFFIINAIVSTSKFTIVETGDPDRGARFEITVPSDRFEIIGK